MAEQITSVYIKVEAFTLDGEFAFEETLMSLEQAANRLGDFKKMLEADNG